MTKAKAKGRHGGGSSGIPPAITTRLALVAKQGTPLLWAIAATGQPLPDLTYTGTLPAGLSWATNPDTGQAVIYGTPSVSGSSSITITARSSAGVDTFTLPITLNPVEVVETNYVPSSIDWTGVDDVYQELNAFIRSAPNGTPSSPTIVKLRPNSAYRCEGIIYRREWKNFVLARYGADSKLFATTDGSAFTDYTGQIKEFDLQQRALLIMEYCENGVVDWEFQGDNPVTDYRLDAIYKEAYELQHGLRLMGCLDMTVKGVAHNTRGDGLWIGSGQIFAGTHRLSERIYVQDFETYQTGRQGIGVVGLRDGALLGGYIHHAGRAAVDYEPIGRPADKGGSDPTSFGVFNVTMRDWRFGPHRLSTIAAKGNGFMDDLALVDLTGDAATDCHFRCFFGASDFNDGQGPGETRHRLWLVRLVFPAFGTQQKGEPIYIQRHRGVYVDGCDVKIQHVLHNYKDGTRSQNTGVEANFCSDVIVTNTNDWSPATGGQLHECNPVAHTLTMPTTVPDIPVCGATFARQADGGWTS